MGAYYRLLLIGLGVQDGRRQVSQALATPVPASTARCCPWFKRPRDRRRHLLLLRTELKIGRARQNSARRKESPRPVSYQVPSGARSLGVYDAESSDASTARPAAFLIPVYSAAGQRNHFLFA